MPTLDMDLNYMELMEEAAKRGDYKSAARYEQLRNQKIDRLNDTGTNKWGATASNDYYGWIDGNNYAADLLDMMANNADKDQVADTLAKRVEKSSNTLGMEKYVNDDIYNQAIQYLMKEPEKQNYGSFSYASAPSYTDKYKNQIDDMLNQILNREDFSYDVTKDPLYAQYAQQYTQQGQRSMKDTLGQLSARTGGLASSYATSAAQQASDYYMGQLANKVPELYQMAYEMYLDDKADQVENLGLLQSMSNTQYDRYRDTMSDWRNDRDFAYGAYRDDISDQQWQQSFDNANKQWQTNFDNANKQWQQSFDYGVSQDAISNERYDTEYAYKQALQQAETLAQYGDFSGYKNLGYTDEQINAMRGGYEQNINTSQIEPADEYKPSLTWNQVKTEIEEGNTTDAVLKAYEYYMGEKYEGTSRDEDVPEKTKIMEIMEAKMLSSTFTDTMKFGELELALQRGQITEEEYVKLARMAGLI